MGAPGNRDDGQDLAPFYIMKVEGTKLEGDITNFLQMVEYESAVDLLDMLKLTVHNPGFVFDLGGPDFTSHLVFQPGNEVDLWFGYGKPADAIYIGRAIVDKHLPRFPESGIPVLELRAYDAAKRMAQETAEITTAPNPRKKKTKPDPIGAAFTKKTHSQIVEEVAAKYGFDADVALTDKVDTIWRKKDMTDYQLVRGLASINSMEFWVDFDLKLKRWVLHWKPSDETKRPTYELAYGTENSPIFHCEAEYGLSQQITEIQVMYFSPTTQDWQRISLSEEKPGAPMKYQKSSATATAQSPKKRPGGSTKAKSQKDVINEEIKNVETLRLAAGGHSIDVIPNRRFKDAADAQAFALRWFKARKDHFIILKGETIGIETMMARQTHKISGIGKRLSGNYYFTSVRHKFSAGSQYRCEFIANKVMET